MAYSLGVNEDAAPVAPVLRLRQGRSRLSFKMSKRKFVGASIQFCFFISAVNNPKPHRIWDRKGNGITVFMKP